MKIEGQFQSLNEISEKTKNQVKIGRFYHWSRDIIIQTDNKALYHITLNFFERVVLFFNGNYLNKTLSASRVIVLDSKKINSLKESTHNEPRSSIQTIVKTTNDVPEKRFAKEVLRGILSKYTICNTIESMDAIIGCQLTLEKFINKNKKDNRAVVGPNNFFKQENLKSDSEGTLRYAVLSGKIHAYQRAVRPPETFVVYVTEEAIAKKNLITDPRSDAVLWTKDALEALALKL